MQIKMLTLLGAAALLAGCASLGDPKLLQPLTKVTVVSVTSNPKLYYVGDEAPKGDLFDMATSVASNDGKNNSLLNKLTEKTPPYLAKGEELLIAALAGTKDSPLVSKDTVLTSKSYGGAAEDKVFGVGILHAEGYKFVKLNGSLAADLASELGANGVITATFLFQKRMEMGMMGTGTLGAQTALTVTAYDSKNKMVFSKSYIGLNKTNVGVVADVYDPNKFEAVVAEATKAAVDKFSDDLAAR